MAELGKSLGCAIRRRRWELGYSQEALSEDADVHWTQISHIENGQSSPTFRVLERLAGALQIEVSALVKMAEKISKEEAMD
ncbi:MAG: helix-turn-helix transcriptional regulator [bacterium]|nr:helix-turn-helix transcriptional regulator [bacterium]